MGRRVRVRRSGGFAGVAVERAVDLDELAGRDPAASSELASLVTASGLEEAGGEGAPGEPQPDRFVYEFEVDGVRRTLGEADLTAEQRQVASAVLRHGGRSGDPA